MIFFYGTRSAKIKKYDDAHLKCENCGEYKSRFTVHQRYAHLFWIPFFPVSRKHIYGECTNCGQELYDEKANNYLSMTRTPWYLFFGLIVFVGFFVFAGFQNHSNQKKKAEYIANPVAGDIYTIKYDEDGKSVYFFMKVDAVEQDSVIVLFNGYEYYKFPSKMVEEDYFDEEEYYMYSKEQLTEFLSDGTIRAVKR